MLTTSIIMSRKDCFWIDWQPSADLEITKDIAARKKILIIFAHQYGKVSDVKNDIHAFILWKQTDIYQKLWSLWIELNKYLGRRKANTPPPPHLFLLFVWMGNRSNTPNKIKHTVGWLAGLVALCQPLKWINFVSKLFHTIFIHLFRMKWAEMWISSGMECFM